MNESRGRRDMSMELLRILACFMVIFLHVSAGNWTGPPVKSFNWQVFNIYDSLVRSCVPIFVLITGAFFLRPENKVTIRDLYRKNVLRLVIIYVFWSVFYALFVRFAEQGPGGEWTVQLVVQDIIKSRYHLWYIPMLIGLYVISPVLKGFTESPGRKTVKYVICLYIVGLTVNSALQFITLPYYEWISIVLNKFPIALVCQFPGYLITGYYLYRYELSKKTRILLYLSGVLSFLLTVISSSLMSIRLDEPTGVMYGFLQITSYLEACALFVLFKNVFQKRTFSTAQVKVITRISGCTLGIYLMHDIFLVIMRVCFGLSTVKFNALLSVPVMSLTAFAVTLVLVLLVKKIPWAGKNII